MNSGSIGADGSYPGGLDVSANGSRIVFGAATARGRALLTVNADGTGLRFIRNNLNALFAAAISGDGSTMNQRQAVLRWLWLWGPQAIIGVIPFVALFAWPLEILYGLFLLYTTSQSPKRQGYHDVKSNTVVIKRVAA